MSHPRHYTNEQRIKYQNLMTYISGECVEAPLKQFSLCCKHESTTTTTLLRKLKTKRFGDNDSNNTSDNSNYISNISGIKTKTDDNSSNDINAAISDSNITNQNCSRKDNGDHKTCSITSVSTTTQTENRISNTNNNNTRCLSLNINIPKLSVMNTTNNYTPSITSKSIKKYLFGGFPNI